MDRTKQDRTLEIFFRGLRGENISVADLATEYDVSPKSITRSVNDIKAFLLDHRDLVGNAEMEYSYRDKVYRLKMDNFLSAKELFAIVEILIGARAFSKAELLSLTNKLKQFTTAADRSKLSKHIANELYHYAEVRHDCDSVTDRLWQLVNVISEKREISVDYYKADRSFVTHRLRPVALMFSEYYFYLIGFEVDGDPNSARYFRVDRIKNITIHRTETLTAGEPPIFDEGLLRERSVLMFPGKLRTIRFLYTGPSVQAVLDKLPTAKIVERPAQGFILEAEVYGDGIKMWLLSQGTWVQLLAPEEYVAEMRATVEKMMEFYR